MGRRSVGTYVRARRVLEDDVVEHDPALHDRRQARDGAQQRGLPGAVRAEDRDHFTGLHLQRDREVERAEPELNVRLKHQSSLR